MTDKNTKPANPDKPKRMRAADPVNAATKALKSYRKATAAETACKKAVEALGTGEARTLFDTFVAALAPKPAK